MVLEKITVEIINKLLGNIFENVNRKQLNIGLWSGKVTLTDLKLKNCILENFNIPLKVVHGNLGKLNLQIPWKNIYTQPLIAEADDLFICITNNSPEPFDAEKEAQKKLESKLSQLSRYEEFLMENEEPDLPTFREKLLATAIRNIQIKISNVYVIYEDFTIDGPTFWGVTLHNLEIYSTDSEWQKRIYTDSLGLCYKIAFIDSLTIFLNYKTDTFKTLKLYKKYLRKFKRTKIFPEKFNYIFGPTSTSLKLKINMMPENDKPPFQIPKVDLLVEENLLEFAVSRDQYKYILEFCDTVWRYNLNEPYRKYRPYNKPIKGNSTLWWKFVLNSILDWIQNRRKVWRWSYIKNHRQMCRNYEEAFRKKELLSKPPQTLLVTLRLLEEKLDLFNLLLIRQRVLLTINHVKNNIQMETSKQSKWFGGFLPGKWFSDKKEIHEEDISILLRKFKKELTKTEKEKLFNAIGYSRNNAPLYIPESYSSVLLYAYLKELKISFHAKTKTKTKGRPKEIACLSIKKIFGELHYRPTANSIFISASLGDLKITGTIQNGYIPTIVECSHRKSNLLDLSYELNPIDKSCDHKFFFLSRSLQVIYDSTTFLNVFNTLIIFERYFIGERLTPNVVKKSSNVTYSIIRLINSSSATFDIHIEIMSNIIIIPKNGFYIPNESCIILLSLGKALVKLKPRERLSLSDVEYRGELEKIQEKILKAAYNYLHITTSHTQILIVFPEEDWKNAIHDSVKAGMHILKPTSVISKLGICTLKKNRYLPEITLNVEVLSLEFVLREYRVMQLIEILLKTSFPKFDSYNNWTMEAKTLESAQYLPMENRSHSLYTYFKGKFKLNKFYIDYTSDLRSSSKDTALFNLMSINENGGHSRDQTLIFEVLGTNLKIRQSSDAIITKLLLDSVNVVQNPRTQSSETGYNIFRTLRGTDNEGFLTITYIKAKKKTEIFKNRYKNTCNFIKVIVMPIEINVHLQKMLILLQNAKRVQENLLRMVHQRYSSYQQLQNKIYVEENVTFNFMQINPNPVKTENQTNLIIMRFTASVQNVKIVLQAEHHNIASVEISKINFETIKKYGSLGFNGDLKRVILQDLTDLSIHKNILYTTDQNALKFEIIFFELEDKADKTTDELKLYIDIGCIKCVYLKRFTHGCMTFFRHFELPIMLFSQAYDAATDAATVAYDEAMRISFQIDLKAPIIIVPIDSQNINGIEIDLGSLNISNSVTAMVLENEKKIWIDNIRVDLKNLKIKSVSISEEPLSPYSPTLYNNRLSDKEEYKFENILDPTSCYIFVSRNLSKKWNSNIADIQINGALHIIECNVLQSDIGTISSILRGNFQENPLDICLEASLDVPKKTPRKDDFISHL